MSNVTTGTAYADSALAGLVRMNDKSLVDWEHFDYLTLGDVVANIPWSESSESTTHSYTVRTSAPGSAFRSVNAGLANAASQARTDTIALKLFDASLSRDKAVALGYKAGVEAFMSYQTAISLSEAFTDLERQIILGTGNDANGFDGLADYVSAYSDLVYDMGGAGGASMYMGYFGEDGIQMVMKEGKLNVGAVTDAFQTTNVSTGAGYDIVRTSILSWVALQIASTSSYGVVAKGFNFSGATGYEMDDQAIGEVYALFSSEMQKKVNFIITNKNGVKQLQASRTATTPTGQYVPMPKVWNGGYNDIPILVTDALADDASQVVTTTTTTTGG